MNGYLQPVTDNGSMNAGAVYNYGVTGEADRALGSIASASTVPFFGVVFVNNTGAAIDLGTLGVNFRAEQYRTANNAIVEALVFRYATGAAIDLNFTGGINNQALNVNEIVNPTSTTGQAAIDGNAAGNFVVVSQGPGALTGTLANGERLVIRFEDTNDVNSDAGLAIDNFTITGFTAVPVPEPATMLLASTAGLGLVGLVRRRLRA